MERDMGRPAGRTNQGHEEEKRRLAAKLAERLVQPDGPKTSFQSLAEACEVSRATLRHYFGDHQGAIHAAIECLAAQGEPHVASVAHAEFGHVRDALSTLLRLLAVAWQRYGVGAIHRMGLEIGLGDAQLGPLYVQQLLEPTIQAFEKRLMIHIQRGELRPMDPRTGSLLLLSPLLIALLHQEELGGRKCRPLDLDEFLTSHLDAFLRAWAPLPE
ncbi:MAG: TetR/AcrR family transcriptional regulator [Myxococcales bacterium]|nr:TetR/AcrR family transcriptional regulator [Myxococcales bacterium]MCB9641533.1 TetR/AcrR family transcriptional regulator [Myxococcales bacterium]